MDELNQFLNSVEASARKILKQQNKKQQELVARERAALVRAAKQGGGNTVAGSASPSSSLSAVSRDELQATYSPGGALIIPAPTSPNRQRSEHETAPVSPTTHLPRLPPALSLSSTNQQVPSSSSPLPAIDAAKRAQRERRAADKILNSPLYKSLARSKSDQGFAGSGISGNNNSAQTIKKAIQEVDHVNQLLKKLGLRDNLSPTRRPEHAVERRMCNACWAHPDKLTGCEHHPRMLPGHGSSQQQLSGLGDEALLLRQMELQGPTSWLSGDLYVKYRSEADRERLWAAFVRLQELEAERERQGQAADVVVIPIVTRHPIYARFFTQIELENLKTQAETRRRNATKAFVFDVNHIWLTNLDHFNARLLDDRRRRDRDQQRRGRRRGRRRSSLRNTESDDPVGAFAGTSGSGNDDDDEDLDNVGHDDDRALRDRRDEHAIREGYSQIQSISTARALQQAVFPELDPATTSFARHTPPWNASSPSSSRPQSQSSTPTSPPSRSRRRRRRELPHGTFRPPLTLLVCGRWSPSDSPETTTLDRVPGVTLVGTQRVLWWQYAHNDDHPESGFEATKVVALFGRSRTLSSSNAILVSLLLALDCPLLSPLWFAWHVGSKLPPVPPPTPVPPQRPPQLVSPCRTSLLVTKLQSNLDARLPCTMVLLNPLAHGDDHVLGLDEPFGHRRFWDEFDPHAFRQWWRVADALPPNFDVDPQGCSVLVAQPNATGVGGRFTWHAVDAIHQHLNRRRAERDYVYIVQNHQTSGPNDPLYFVVSMTHEVLRDVAAARLSGYLQMLEARRRQQEYEQKLLEIEKKIEMGRLVLEAKRQEQRRIEQELNAKAAIAADRFDTDKMSASTLQEWQDRLEFSRVTDEQRGWQKREITQDESLVVFYYALNEALPPAHRFSWDRPSVWPTDEELAYEVDGKSTSRSDALSTSRSSVSSADSDDDGRSELDEQQRKNREAIQQMATALLADEQFLAVLKAKLGLTAEGGDDDDDATGPRRRSHAAGRGLAREPEADADEAGQLDLRDHMIRVTEEGDRSRASLMAAKMAKLQIPSATSGLRPGNPGEGWKRLKVTKLPRNFARTVYSRHTEGPRSAFINQPNHSTPVGMIDPRESSPYELPEFIPELRSQLIPKPNADLQERKLQWAEYRAMHPPIGVEATAAAPSGSSSATKVTAAQAAKDALFERDPADLERTMEQLVAKAVLCARNNNLEGLEAALDDGVEVNARDNHGNTLFILVCQQGNKKLAKFLMRRHADMNLQNMNGNTALHYLIEYKHTELADYIKSKGAIDTIQNASGLTCYEGLSMEQVEAL